MTRHSAGTPTAEWVRWTADNRWHLVASVITDDGQLKDVKTACADVACEESAGGFVSLKRGGLPPQEYQGETYVVCPTCAKAARP